MIILTFVRNFSIGFFQNPYNTSQMNMPIIITPITSFAIAPPRKPTRVPTPDLKEPFRSLPKTNSNNTAPKNGPKIRPIIPPVRKPAMPPITDPIKPHLVAPYCFAPITNPK